jgi:hypothetical protein
MNLIIGAIILCAASRLFPETVQVSNARTLIIAILLLALVTFLIAIICLILILVGVSTGSLSFTCIGIVAALFANVIAMYVISNYLPGFNIVGFWPKVLLAICFSTFRINITRGKTS